MKQNRRLLSILVVACLIFGLVPMAASANTNYAPSVITGDAITDFQMVNFAGNEWIVLDADATNDGNTNGMLLLSKELAADSIAYNTHGKGSVWSGSNAMAWCATYLGEFSAAEKALLLPATKAATDKAYFDVNWTGDALAAETVFFLSAEEVETYFGENALVGTDYVTDSGWWLRSVNADRDILAGAVSDAGFVGAPHVATNYGARPAINLSSSVVLATAGAKPDSLSAVTDLNAVPVWNLTFLDASMGKISTADADENNTISNFNDYSSWTITVSGTAGDKVSAVITDMIGQILYYGPVAEIAADTTTATVTLPTGLTGKYILKLFTERTVDGIDYAGEPTEYKLFVDDGMGYVDGWNIKLNDHICANFWMDIPEEITNDADAYLEIAVNDYVIKHAFDGSFDTTGYEQGATPVTIDVAAAQMTDVVTITIVDGEGNRSNTYEYSVRKYANVILSGDYSEEAKKMVSTMLNYGAKAQQYFGYNTDRLADVGITVKEDIVPNNNRAAEIQSSAQGVVFSGASLVHESKTAVRFYFTITQGTHEITFNGTPCRQITKGSMVYVEIDGINPDKLDKPITVSVDGTMTVTYSPMYYIERMYHKSTTKDTLKDLLSAMYTYWNAAVAYAKASN